MHWCIRGDDATAIPRDDWVNPVIVDVGVENLSPSPWAGKTDRVVIPGAFRERGNHHDVLACAFDPAVKRDHTVQIVYMKWVYIVLAQRSMIPAQTDEILRKAKMIHHCGIGSRVQAISPKKIRRLGIPAPLLVFQKLLPHEELGMPGAVSRIPMAKRVRLRAYQGRRSDESER
jgi:hypothetical protein